MTLFDLFNTKDFQKINRHKSSQIINHTNYIDLRTCESSSGFLITLPTIRDSYYQITIKAKNHNENPLFVHVESTFTKNRLIPRVYRFKDVDCMQLMVIQFKADSNLTEFGLLSWTNNPQTYLQIFNCNIICCDYLNKQGQIEHENEIEENKDNEIDDNKDNEIDDNKDNEIEKNQDNEIDENNDNEIEDNEIEDNEIEDNKIEDNEIDENKDSEIEDNEIEENKDNEIEDEIEENEIEENNEEEDEDSADDDVEFDEGYDINKDDISKKYYVDEDEDEDEDELPELLPSEFILPEDLIDEEDDDNEIEYDKKIEEYDEVGDDDETKEYYENRDDDKEVDDDNQVDYKQSDLFEDIGVQFNTTAEELDDDDSEFDLDIDPDILLSDLGFGNIKI